MLQRRLKVQHVQVHKLLYPFLPGPDLSATHKVALLVCEQCSSHLCRGNPVARVKAGKATATPGVHHAQQQTCVVTHRRGQGRAGEGGYLCLVLHDFRGEGG